MYSVSNLSIAIGNKYLLNNINLDFESGCVNAIIGPNGAGKSTLLKALAGLTSISSGTILFNNVALKKYDSNTLAQKRAFLSQHPNTAFSFNVYDIVMLGRFPFFGTKPSQNDVDIVKQAMKLTGVTHLSDRSSLSLSGGEVQRVHFARVIAQCLNKENDFSDKVLLLDEPANNLDPKYQFELMQTIKKLSVEYKLTVIMVMHDLNLTAQFSDKIVLMNKGKVVDYDTPERVLEVKQLEDVYEIPFSVMHLETGLYLCAGTRCEYVELE
jgi:iron complex transport system ATP-binding protein